MIHLICKLYFYLIRHEHLVAKYQSIAGNHTRSRDINENKQYTAKNVSLQFLEQCSNLIVSLTILALISAHSMNFFGPAHFLSYHSNATGTSFTKPQSILLQMFHTIVDSNPSLICEIPNHLLHCHLSISYSVWHLMPDQQVCDSPSLLSPQYQLLCLASDARPAGL